MNPIFGLSLRAWTWIGATLLCLAVWAGLAWAWNSHNETMREEGRAQVREQWQADVAHEQKAQDALKVAREAQEKKDETIHAATVARLAADAASSRDAAERLRQRVVQLIAAARRQGGTDPAPAGQRPGEPDTGALDLLAFMLWRTDSAAGQLGEYADQLRAAGERCERHADTLNMQLSPAASDGHGSPGTP